MRRDRYVVAVRRERRDVVPADWIDRVDSIPGLKVLGSSPQRAQIQATPLAISRLQEVLGKDFYLEPVIEHTPVRGMAV